MLRGREVLGVWSKGVFFSLGDLPPGLRQQIAFFLCL